MTSAAPQPGTPTPAPPGTTAQPLAGSADTPAGGASTATQRGPVVPGTRTARAWWALALGGFLLLLVLIFILQNLSATTASFLVVRWSIPLGIDLLLAALLGGLVVFLLGLARMLQLRRLARRYAHGARPGSEGAQGR